MTQASNEARISALERELAELKRQVNDALANVEHLERRQDDAEDIDRALLDRVDRISGELRRIEREMHAGFRDVRSDIAGLTAQVRTLQADFARMFSETSEAFTGVDKNFADIRDILETHKAALDDLQAGQRQILDLLLGGSGPSKVND